MTPRIKGKSEIVKSGWFARGMIHVRKSLKRAPLLATHISCQAATAIRLRLARSLAIGVSKMCFCRAPLIMVAMTVMLSCTNAGVRHSRAYFYEKTWGHGSPAIVMNPDETYSLVRHRIKGKQALEEEISGGTYSVRSDGTIVLLDRVSKLFMIIVVNNDSKRSTFEPVADMTLPGVAVLTENIVIEP